MTNKEAEKILEEAASKLGEHFDSVQIMISWNDNGYTMCCKRGVGNWYARQGMAHEFINEDVAKENALHIANELKEDREE